MALRVAEAPSVAVNRVATYRELDSDLLRHVAFATIDDIDLRLLTKGGRGGFTSSLVRHSAPTNQGFTI